MDKQMDKTWRKAGALGRLYAAKKISWGQAMNRLSKIARRLGEHNRDNAIMAYVSFGYNAYPREDMPLVDFYAERLVLNTDELFPWEELGR